jgi:hypothetical protein
MAALRSEWFRIFENYCAVAGCLDSVVSDNICYVNQKNSNYADIDIYMGCTGLINKATTQALT